MYMSSPMQYVWLYGFSHSHTQEVVEKQKLHKRIRTLKIHTPPK